MGNLCCCCCTNSDNYDYMRAEHHKTLLDNCMSLGDFYKKYGYPNIIQTKETGFFTRTIVEDSILF